MGQVVAMEQSTRAAVMREVRAFFEPYEDSTGLWDLTKLPPRTSKWSFVNAARCAFWAMNENALVSARIGYLCDAAECVVEANRSVDDASALECVGDYPSVKSWIALAQSYLREDIAKMVKPSCRKQV